MMYTLVYSITKEEHPETVYINLTNACTNSCIFCLRNQKDDVCGAEMWHDDEYQFEDIVNQFQKFLTPANGLTPHPNPLLKEREYSVKNVVFCGYGEPFLRREMMKEFCKYLRKNHPEIKIRVNTNGHANAIYRTNVAEEFKELIDSVSISLNASNEDEYDQICKPKIKNAYEEVKKFIKACVAAGIDVSTSVVTGLDKIHHIDAEKCEKIATELGAKFRNREFIENGY